MASINIAEQIQHADPDFAKSTMAVAIALQLEAALKLHQLFWALITRPVTHQPKIQHFVIPVDTQCIHVPHFSEI